jgi:hypothetical protein
MSKVEVEEAFLKLYKENIFNRDPCEGGHLGHHDIVNRIIKLGASDWYLKLYCCGGHLEMDPLMSIATKCPEFKDYPLNLIKLLICYGIDNDGWYHVVDRYVKEKRTDLYKDMEKAIVKDIYEAVPIVLGLYIKQDEQTKANSNTTNNK